MAVGAIPFEHWMDGLQGLSTFQSNLLMMAFGALFLVLPGYFGVLGPGASFQSDWPLHASERARYGGVVKRMLVWFLSAGTVFALWSIGSTLLW